MTFEEIRKRHGLGSKETETSSKTTTESSPSVTTKTSSGKGLDAYNEIRKRYGVGERFNVVNDNYINTFISDVNKYASADKKSSYSEWNRLNLGSRASTIQGWLQYNKSNLDEETYKEYSDYIDSLIKLNETFSQYKDGKDYYDSLIGWLSPNAEYTTEAVSARKEQYQSNQARIAEIEKELDSWGFFEQFFANEANEKTKHMRSIQAEKEALQAENLRYEYEQKKLDDHYTPVTEEFKKNAAFRDYTNASKEDIWEHDAIVKDIVHNLSYDHDGNMVDANGSGKIVYEANHPIVEAMRENNLDGFYNTIVEDKLGMFLSASQEDHDLAYERLLVDNQYDKWALLMNEGKVNAWNELTEGEIDIYYNYLKTQGQEAAYKYLDDMAVVLTKRATDKRAEEISKAELFSLEQIMMNAASIPMSVLGGAVGLLGDIGNVIEGKEYNPYSSAHSLSNDASAIRQDTASDIDKATGNFAIPWVDFTIGDLYQSGMSFADSRFANLIGGPVGELFLGTGAATSAMKNAYERGASTEQIVALGVLNGLAEATFEHISMDKLKALKNMDKKAVKNFWQGLLRTTIMGGVEASEEVLTEAANTLSDYLVMGTQSEWEDWETFAKNVVNAGLGGFFSGLGGGAIASVANYSKYAQQRDEHGQSIIDTVNGVDSLRALALDMAGVNQNKDGQKLATLAGKVESKASAKNVGKLSAKMEDTIIKQNQTDIQKALVEKGLSEKDAKRVSEYLGSNKALTEKQKAEIEGNESIKAVMDELVNNKKSAISERGRNLLAARLGVDMKNAKVNASKSGELSLRNDVDVKERISETGKTTITTTDENGKSVDVEVTIDKKNPIAKVKYVNDERIVYLNTDHGIVEASNVKYANEEEGLLYEAFVDMNPAFANAVIKNYDGSVPIQTYINGMREGMILYGMHNFQAVGKDISKNSYLADLSEADQAFALKLGKAYAEADAKKANTNLRTAIKNAAEKAKATEGASTTEATQNKPKKGKVSFEDGAKAETHKQHRRVVALAKHLASAIGIDIVFYDSRITGKKAGQGANGYFDADTDTIYLDLQNAQDDAKTIVYTLSHELVHFIKKWSPQKFNTFAEFLMKQYASHGVSAANLLKQKMVELNTTDADLAYEEMICDACETMLLDSNAVVKLMELRKSDLELFEKIKLHVLKILNDIREAYKKLGYQPTSDEAKALLGMKDVLEQFYSLFEEAAVDATKTYQMAQTLDTDSVSVSKDGTIKLQMKQYQQTGRSTLLNYLTEQYGKDNAYDLISTIDNIYNTLVEIKKDEALSVFSNWQDTEVELDENGHPIFTTSINNGDYELNQDFSRVCKKRRQLDFVLNMLAEDPAFEASNLTKSDFVKINKAIKNHGFEIACALCFVDSKRFRQAEWADSFANTWNDILNSVVKDSSKLTPFNFATKNPNIADDGIEIDTSKAVMYRKWSDGKEDVKNRRNYESFEQMLAKDNDGKWLEGNTNVRTIATLIRDNPSLRHTFRGADIIASQGFDTIQRLAPGIRSILDGWGGSSVPKPSSSDASYDSSIINLNSYNKETAYAMGGARMNSFSDFMAHMFFDYCQAFADLSAKELPSQAYTKELIYVRLFGRSGQKINMSGIAAIRGDSLPTTASKEVSKAQAEANEKIEKMIAGLDVTRLLEHLHKDIYQLTETDVEQFLDMCDYVWADESINMKHATLLQTGILYDKLSESKVEECYELLKAGEIEQALKVAGEENVDMAYAKHCGTIVVGVSDAHIRKLLRDPTVRMVIPYHKSGLNPVIARELRISAYNDYTLTQTTGVRRKGTKTTDKIGSKAIKDAYGLKDFSFYDWFGKTIDGKLYDGKATADKYLEWCEKGYYDENVGDYVYYTTKGEGYILAKEFHKKASIVPKFDAFMGEENYYKVLEDFDCYDTISGEHSAQGAVDFFRSGLPSDYKTVLVDALKEEQKVHDDFRDHLDNKGLKDEVMEIVKARGYNPSIKKQLKKIKAGMTEAERYSALKDAKIIAISDLKSKEQPLYSEIEKIPEKAKGQIEKLIKDLADALEILNVPLSTAALDIEFQLSKNKGLRESLSQQLKYGGNFHDFAKALINLQDILERAVLIEVHTEDRYKGTDREDASFEAGYVLFSAFKTQEYVIPVKLEIKQKKDVHNILYVVVSMTKIKRISVMESAIDDNDVSTIPLSVTDSVYSLSHLASKVNPQDRHFLKYLPNPMLSVEQQEAKNIALEEDKRKLDAIPKKSDSIKKQLKKTSNRSLLANALETTAQNDIERNKLAQYKEKISLIESEQAKLEELKQQANELRFKKGRTAEETKKMRDLDFKANQAANRINTYDRQLLNLESTTALKGVLEREKELVRKRTEAKGREALDAYREKMTKTQRELLTRYKEQRKEQRERATERKDKTTLRRKIRKLVKELNNLFKNGTKKRNIKEEMKGAVASSLALADVLFNDDIKNEDIVRLGVASVTTKESEYLNKYRDLLDVRDSLYAEIESIHANGMVRETMLVEVGKVEEKLEKVNGQIAYLNNKLSDLFERERARLNKSTVDAIIDELITEYSKLKDSENGYIKNAYSEAMEKRLKAFKEALQGTVAKDMDVYQLQEFYDTFKAIEHMIRYSNSLFRDGRTEDLMTYVSNVQGEIYEASTEQKDRSLATEKIVGMLNEFSWNNLRPVDAVERLGSETFEKLFWDFVHAMGTAARDITEAGEVIASAREKFGYSKWNMELADTTFTTRDGLKFKPSLADKLSIYAYSQRDQAEDHMVDGGFTYDTGRTYKETKNGKTYVRRKLSNTYRLSKENIQTIIDSLTQEQRGYVNAILPYLTDMGKKGNEVSMTLYGIELFGEKVYFPLQSSRDYLSSTTQTLGATPTMASLANSGFTKQTKPHASNPIVLRGFDDVVLEHIEKMSNYHALVIPIENLRRVFDNVGREMEGMPISTKALIGSRFGVEAQKYFEQWLTDINGGITPSGVKHPFMKLFSRAKGTAVAANLSVVAQQYFSIIRAMEVVNPKYFTPFLEAKKTDMKQYEELLKYAPIAIIKEMGGFDVGSGGRTKDYIGYKGARKDAKYIKKKVDDFWMAGASAMDKLGWVTIWKAVKAEVASEQKLKPGTDEFYEACRVRFTEVVTKTQVFDSVASRSGYMRSQHDAVKYATSFMGEPTAIVGRCFVAGLNLVRAYKSGNKARKKVAWGSLVRTASVIAVSNVLGKIAVSLVYAGRDDDEDEAYLERWMRNLGEALADDFKPYGIAGYLPFGRDLVSLFEGYSVERPEMQLIEDVFKSAKKATDGDLTFDDSLNLVGSVGNFFGQPLKNIIREIKSAINVVGDAFDDIHPTDIGGAFAEGFTGDERSKTEMLYDSIMSGDTERVNVIKATYKTETAYTSALRTALTENDSRIAEAVMAHYEGDVKKRASLTLEIEKEGNFSQNIVRGAINNEITRLGNKIKAALKAKETDTAEYKKIVKELREMYPKDFVEKMLKDTIVEDEEETESKDISLYKIDDYYTSILNGNSVVTDTIYEELINEKLAEGYLPVEAEDMIASSFSTKVKEAYMDGDITRTKATSLLVSHGGKKDSDAEIEIKKCDFELNHDISWSERARAYRLGKISKSALISAVMDIEGEEREGAEEYIRFLELEMDNPTIDITASDATSYFKYAEPAGIRIDVYLDYKEQISGIESDKDANGNSISGSKKAKLMSIINSLPLSTSQKDALYFAEGWAKGNLWQAPWH